MHSTLNSFGNSLTILEYLSIIRDSFIVTSKPFLLQKKIIIETFLGFHCCEENFSNSMKYIFFHALLICLQIVQLANVY